jgi:soluble lytic murein transglycosylase-like protein
MRTRLQLALMALPAIAISFLTTPFTQAATGTEAAAQHIGATQENGRTVYVNADTPDPAQSGSSGPRHTYVYWSVTEHRWKPVPGVRTMRAARSAAAEVRQLLAPQRSVAAAEFVSPERIDSAIEQAAARHNVDPNLVRAVIKVESNFNPHAVSAKGAMGLMQLMPATARELKVSDAFDPAQNVDAGVRHLRTLLDNFGGDPRLALAAYNAGAGAVLRHGGVPRYSETQNYVRRITELYGGGKAGTLGPGRAPVHMFRDGQGVLTMSNVE